MTTMVEPRLAPDPPDSPAGLRILLVEDDDISLLVAACMLRHLGHQVAVARNGAEALVRHGAQTYDLVLMDQHMPVMSGAMATGQIRAREREAGQPRMPIIGLTADAGDDRHLIAAGMDAVLQKPCRYEQFDERFLRAMFSRQLGAVH